MTFPFLTAPAWGKPRISRFPPFFRPPPLSHVCRPAVGLHLECLHHLPSLALSPRDAIQPAVTGTLHATLKSSSPACLSPKVLTQPHRCLVSTSHTKPMLSLHPFYSSGTHHPGHPRPCLHSLTHIRIVQPKSHTTVCQVYLRTVSESIFSHIYSLSPDYACVPQPTFCSAARAHILEHKSNPGIPRLKTWDPLGTAQTLLNLVNNAKTQAVATPGHLGKKTQLWLLVTSVAYDTHGRGREYQNALSK